MEPITAAIGLANLAGNIFGAFQQRQQQNWMNGALINLLNYYRQIGGNAENQSNSLWDYIKGDQIDLNSYYQDLLRNGGTLGNNITRIDDAFGNLNTLFRGGPESIPGYSQAFDRLSGAVGQFNPANLDRMSDIIGAGGFTEQTGNAVDRALEMALGLGAPNAVLGDVGMDVLGQRGQNNTTLQLQQLMNRVLDQEGWNNELRSLFDAGQSLMANPGTDATRALTGAGMGAMQQGGFTPAQLAAQEAGLMGILSGGANDVTDYMTGRGAEITQINPLLSMDEVTSAARNQAATNAVRAAENARRQAFARGGGSGAVVATGGQNEGLTAVYDEALRQESEAVQQARLAQQGLQLQHFGQGQDFVGSGQGLANQRLNTFASLLPATEANAIRRLSTGGELTGTGQSLENQRFFGGADLSRGATMDANTRMNTVGNLGLGGGRLELDRMMSGGSLVDMFNQSRARGMGLVNDLTQGATSRLNTGISGYNNLFNTNLAGEGALADLFFRGSNLGQQQGQNYMQAYLGLLGSGNDLSQILQRGQQGASNQLDSGFRTWVSLLSNLAGAQSGLFGAPQPTNMFRNMVPEGLANSLRPNSGGATGGND